jgi:hypothetical protein
MRVFRDAVMPKAQASRKTLPIVIYRTHKFEEGNASKKPDLRSRPYQRGWHYKMIKMG